MFLGNSSNVVQFRLSFFEVGQSNNGSGLFVNESAESGFILDDGIRDVHTLAKGGKEDDGFDGIDVAGNKNQLSLFLFNKVSNMVQTVFEGDGLR